MAVAEAIPTDRRLLRLHRTFLVLVYVISILMVPTIFSWVSMYFYSFEFPNHSLFRTLMCFVLVPLVLLSRPRSTTFTVTFLFASIFLIWFLDYFAMSYLYPLDERSSGDWPELHTPFKEKIIYVVGSLRLGLMMVLAIVLCFRFPVWRLTAFVLAVLAIPPLPWSFYRPNNPAHIEWQKEETIRREAEEKHIASLPRFEDEDEGLAQGFDEFLIGSEDDHPRIVTLEENGDVSYSSQKYSYTDDTVRFPRWGIFITFAIYCWLPFAWIEKFQRRVGLREGVEA